MFGSMPNAGPRQPNQYERYLLHMPRHKNSMFVRNLCPSPCNCCPPPSSDALFVPVRSGRSVLPNKKKGVGPFSSSSKNHGFTRNAGNLFVHLRSSTSHNLANNGPFGSFRCSQEGVKTRPKRPLVKAPNQLLLRAVFNDRIK